MGFVVDNNKDRIELFVSAGDRFFLYTDGLIEKPRERKVWSGVLPELLDACPQVRDVPIEKAAEMLCRLMLKDQDASEDDVVLLGIEV